MNRTSCALLAVGTLAVAAALSSAAPKPQPPQQSRPVRTPPSAVVPAADIAIVDIGTTGPPGFCPLFTFRNTGKMPINHRIAFIFKTNGQMVSHTGVDFNLAVGETYIFGRACLASHQQFARWGDELEVFLDPENKFAESNKTNNYLRKTIPHPLPTRPPAMPTRTPAPR